MKNILSSFKKGKGALLPVIWALSWPTMLEQLLQTAVQYIDAAMVGRLGAEATAAVGVTTTLGWLISGTVMALGVGFLFFIAREIGAGNEKRAKQASAQAVSVTLAAGIVFTVIPLLLHKQIPLWMHADPRIADAAARYFFILYIPMLPRAASMVFATLLRASGDTKTPMIISLLMNLVNIVLNFILIYPARTVMFFGQSLSLYGAGLGIDGAAIASAVSLALGGLGMTYKLWKHPVISPKGQTFKPDMTVLRPCLKVALPAALQRFATSFGYVAFASMINALGTVATAAHSIANTVESAFYIPGYGMQAAAATLAGNTVGMKDKRRMRDLAQMLLLIEVSLMVVSGGLLYLFAPGMMQLFTSDAAVILLGAAVLRMVALTEPVYGVSIVIEGILQGVGDTMNAFIYNVLGMWGVRIVGTFICTKYLGMGMISAWSCMIAHNILLFVLLLIHYKRGKWNPLNKAN
ncbi:MAG: MATE family efflux transporter [Clostridia bacterium]|nr:MATE family efflux transporter [Clostridia bacterium]